jgi:hypothetical protein
VTLALLLLSGGFGIMALVLGARWLDAFYWRRSLVAFSLSLPQGLTIEQVAHWLTLVNASTHAHSLALLPAPPVALEIVGTREGITHYVLVPLSMRGMRSALPTFKSRSSCTRRASTPKRHCMS